MTEMRKVWKTQEMKRREKEKTAMDAWQAAGSQGPRPELPVHLLASSLRSVMLKLFMEHVDAKLPHDHPYKANTVKLAKLELKEYDSYIFRAQPRHREYASGLWAIMYQENVTKKVRAEFGGLFKLNLKETRFAAQHSQDGPLVKWLVHWKEQQQRQVPDDDETLMESQDDEGAGGVKRGRSRR